MAYHFFCCAVTATDHPVGVYSRSRSANDKMYDFMYREVLRLSFQQSSGGTYSLTRNRSTAEECGAIGGSIFCRRTNSTNLFSFRLLRRGQKRSDIWLHGCSIAHLLKRRRGGEETRITVHPAYVTRRQMGRALIHYMRLHCYSSVKYSSFSTHTHVL